MKNVRPTEADATVTRGVDILAELLTSPNDHQRRAAIVGILQDSIGSVRAILFDRLIDILRDGGEKLRLRSAASLTEIGPSVVAALVYRLLNTRNASLQIRLVDVLVRIGTALPPDRRVEIQSHLDIALSCARSLDVAVAIEQAQLELRPTAKTPQPLLATCAGTAFRGK